MFLQHKPDNTTAMNEIDSADLVHPKTATPRLTAATTTDSYADYAENFDLSLLPMDNEIEPLSHLEHLQQQQDPIQIPVQISNNLLKVPTHQSQQFSRSQSSEYILSSVFEATGTSDQSWCDNVNDNGSHHINPKVIVQKAATDNNSDTPNDIYQFCSSKFPIYSIASLSPPQEQFLTIFPPSPTPSLEFTNGGTFATVKQEQQQTYGKFGLYPPSPPDSNGAPSPLGYQYGEIKSEPFDIGYSESSIDIDSFFHNSFELAASNNITQTPSTSPSSSGSSPLSSFSNSIELAFAVHHLQQQQQNQKKDHQLLREYLQDTTFQRKHNLKPLALESLFISDWDARGDIEPVISLALEHARNDVQQTCITLNISSDPQEWSRNQVQAWLQFTLKQFKLPLTQNIERIFAEDGEQLSRLNEMDFINRIPQAGATLFAQLEIWKAACCFDAQETYLNGSDTAQQTTTTTATTASIDQQGNRLQSWNSPMEYESIDDSFKNDESEKLSFNCNPISIDATDQAQAKFSSSSNNNNNNKNDLSMNPICTPIPASNLALQSDQQAQEVEKQQTEPEKAAVANGGVATALPLKTGRQGSAHIHLWQFLKELLASPQNYGTAIRWLDRGNGVFKIEDSVRVARLWGRRKNRPAMNYDKLSRSIRQYYKKGIMKKTERSQRLVYQFCSPYCM